MCNGMTGAGFAEDDAPCWGATGSELLGFVEGAVEEDAGALAVPLFEAATGVCGKAPTGDAPFMACRVRGGSISSLDVSSGWCNEGSAARLPSNGRDAAPVCWRIRLRMQENQVPNHGTGLLLRRRCPLFALWSSLCSWHAAGAASRNPGPL
jgi:hypothetical protein